ncbi:MAG: hypothetical protein HY730_04680 [Candidatus Tectomicrobia bacterium]|uniref:Cytosolic protein n=1 Tax=Tectimicrobiota bacterium TaxID=2528274 RepID=A0A933GMW4_UNCTE|nr:hypothetical protein [Candidatus Tectomicrobia bacterium]
MMTQAQVDNILKGSYDLHIHAFPDLQPRKLDALDLVKEAREAGLAGCLLKDHSFATTDRAYILNKIFPDFTVAGALVLNYPTGGLNPAAVEAAIKAGAKQIYMPTYAAANQVRKMGQVSFFGPYPFPKNQQGIAIINDKGALVPEVEAILDLIAQNSNSNRVILGTGHLSSEEIMPLVKKAKATGVKKILITHASFQLIGLPLARQMEAIGHGAFIEHSYFGATFQGHLTPVEEMAKQIRAVGVEHCLLSTDFGQTANPTPVEGFKSFIGNLLSLGFTSKEIRTMIVENPLKLLDEG